MKQISIEADWGKQMYINIISIQIISENMSDNAKFASYPCDQLYHLHS